MSPEPTPGKLLVFTAPSGAGKTTIVQHLLRTFPDRLAFSVSATTRPPRPGEIDGQHYHFLSPADFERLVREGAFVEYEEVYPGRFYGTLRSEVDRICDSGRHVLFDIEVKGATNIKKQFGDRCRTVFVDPPSPEVLFARLRGRSTEDEESLRVRIARATEELDYRDTFDEVLVNDDLPTALRAAEDIVRRVKA